MTNIEIFKQLVRADNNLSLVCVDPGGRADGGTGVALFYGPGKPFDSRLLHSNAKDYEERCTNICYQFKNFLISVRSVANQRAIHKNEPRPTKWLAIEKPKFFNTFTGQVAAETNSLTKLAYLYGRLYQIGIDEDFTVLEVFPDVWKGQLNKGQVIRRIERLIDVHYEGDIADAVGLGLFLLGYKI